MNRGFTVVEILVTLVIMSILLTLGVVGMRSVLANGRDSERKADIDVISRTLEQRYNYGNSLFVVDPAGFFYPSARYVVDKGTYPGALEFLYGLGFPKGEFTPGTNPVGGRDYLYRALSVSKNAVTTPSGNEIELICNSGSCASGEDATQLSAVFTSGATILDRYVYEPINASNGICDSAAFTYEPCVRYNLYWISETDSTVYKGIAGLKVLRSRHQ